MLNRDDFTKQILKLWDEHHLDRIPREYALRPDLVDYPLFRRPLIGIASAQDPLFARMKEPGVVGPEYLTPTEWLPSACTVISVFLPFSYEILDNGAPTIIGDYPFGPDGPEEYLWPSVHWQSARIEGERAIVTWKRLMCKLLQDMGYEAILPSDDPRYHVFEPTHSTWSERHAAFVAGLGTFSLNKGMITEEGMAGRFGSIITSAEIPADTRPYTDIYEYCIRCGACAAACPVHALDPSKPINEAKDKYACGTYLQYIKDYSAAGHDTRWPEDRNLPQPEIVCDHYGCSGCQLGMPCERHRP